MHRISDPRAVISAILSTPVTLLELSYDEDTDATAYTVSVDDVKIDVPHTVVTVNATSWEWTYEDGDAWPVQRPWYLAIDYGAGVRTGDYIGRYIRMVRRAETAQ